MNCNSIIKKYFSSKIRLLCSLIFLVLLSVAIKMASPLIINHLIDNHIIPNDINNYIIIIWAISMGLLAFLGFIFDSQRIIKKTNLSNGITSTLNKHSYSALLKSEQLELEKIDKNQIVETITKSASKIGHEYFQRVFNFFYEWIVLIGLVIALFLVNPWIALLTVLTVPMFYFLVKQINKFIITRDEKNNKVKSKHYQLISNQVTNIKNIKLLNSIQEEELRYDDVLYDLEKAHRKQFVLKHFSNGLTSELFVNILITLVVGVGLWLVLHSTFITLGAVVAAIYLIPKIYSTFRKITTLKVLPKHINQEVIAINEILALKPESRAETVQQLDEIYNLKFDDVCWDYGKDSKFNMENINFEVKRGERLGILGLSKSGKSTIVDLLTKVIRPRQGSILINNCDINKVNTYYLRELISVVPQKFTIMHSTIEANITYPFDFDEYNYNDALNKCHLKPVINRLEKKDKTIINQSSDIITNSEKQKIALANAFYKDSRIFVLDEPTSKMEEQSEKDIIEEIMNLKNKIIVLISNRIYNLVMCDKILILNDGKIIEYGKTEELLSNKKSTFTRMVSDYETSKSRIG